LLTGITVRQGGDLWTPQRWNFGPQVSFAWSPRRSGRTLVVRGGYGISFNQEEIALTANAGNNPKSANFYDFNSNNATSINPNIRYGVSSSPTSLYGYAANPNAVTSYNSSNLPAGGHASLDAFGNTSGVLPTAYVHHYSLDTEYDLGGHLIATLGYQGSSAHHLITQSEANAVYAPRGIALNPLVTTINYWGSDGASNDNEFLATLKHRFANQFSAEAQFTWAKSMDDGSGPFELDPYPYNPAYAYGRSDFSIGKAFKAFGVWQPVLFRGGHGWLEKIAGGWELSGIVTIHSGYGWTPIYNTGQSLYCNSCGYSNLRPVYLGGAGHSTSNDAFKSGPGVGNGVNKNFPKQMNATPPPGGSTSYSGSPYFSVADYSAAISGPAFPGVATGLPPAPGIARNSFTGPGYRNVDATFGKAFGLPKAPVLGENAKLEIRADIFNLFNNLNFDPTKVSNNITLANFGQDTVALGARTISFQTRFSF